MILQVPCSALAATGEKKKKKVSRGQPPVWAAALWETLQANEGNYNNEKKKMNKTLSMADP